MKNKLIKSILDLLSSQESVTIEEMQSYLLELKKTKGIEHLTLVKFDVVEVKSEGKGLRIKAIASTPSLDRGNDIVIPEGIKTPNAKGGVLPMLHQHDADLLIGSWDKWGVEDGKFVVEGTVDAPITDWQKDVYAKIENGTLNGISIGFIGIEIVMLENEVRQFNEIELLEVSVVTIPMNQDAHITDVQKIGEDTTEKPNEEPPAEGQAPTEGDEGKTNVVSEVKADAEPSSESDPDTIPADNPADDDSAAILALKEELSKVTEERDALKVRVSELEAELAESESLMEEAVQQQEELLKGVVS